jgi:anaerobic selenocysteine-containing dehydrogenase
MGPIRHSVCALDCPDTCSLVLNVEDGVAKRLRGDPDHPVTRGFLCGKVARYLEREYSPDRLLYPQRRSGARGEGRFERISWDEALDEIAARLRRIADDFGPEAILPYSYAGTMGLLNGSGMDRRFFHRLGASRLDRTICSSAGSAGLEAALGGRFGIETEHFREAKLILAWGANVLATNVHLWPFLVEARRNGAKLYVIDPVRTRTGDAADRHFFIHPGSDAALALGLMHVLIAEGLCDGEYLARHTTGFEELKERVSEYTPERVSDLTGLAAADIVTLAREYGTVKPAAIRLNYGVQRSERGALAVRTVALLPALTGAWRHRGGGLQLSTSGAFKLNRKALERPDLGPPARTVNMSELGKALDTLDDPPVKALVVYNSNPAAIAPNQNLVRAGLRRPDLFTVVLEQFPTDTAAYADILLPATTFLEHTDLYLAYGHYYLQLARPALQAPGECKSNVEIFRLLAARMGFDDPCFADSEDDMIRTLLDTPHPWLAGITLEELERRRFIRLNLPEPFLPFAESYPTPTGKLDFRAAELDYAPPLESRLGDPALRARFPLELIASKVAENLNSTFGNRDEADAAAATLVIHAADAAPRGIADGDLVRVHNDRGSCTLAARIEDRVARGVVHTGAVRWAKRAPDARNVNVLTSDRLTDAGGGPTFFSCLVQVERCGD